MPTAVAQPRQVDGITYSDPIVFVVAGGFGTTDARAVINAYKAYYTKRLIKGADGLPGGWLAYVTARTGVSETVAVGIMRRYRAFYGK